MTTKTAIPHKQVGGSTSLAGAQLPMETAVQSVSACKMDITVLETDRKNHTTRLFVTAYDFGMLATLSIDPAKGYARVDLRLGTADEATALACLTAMETTNARYVRFRWDREDGTAWLRAESLGLSHKAKAARTLVRQLEQVLGQDVFQDLLREEHATKNRLDPRGEVAV